MLNTYEITLENGKNTVTVALRITIGGQINLKKKLKKESALDCIFGAIDSPETMAEVLTEALNFKGNENTITTGYELYDILVDNGYAGPESFVPLLTSIAQTSGIISEKQKKMVDNKAIGITEEIEDTAKN